MTKHRIEGKEQREDNTVVPLLGDHPLVPGNGGIT